MNPPKLPRFVCPKSMASRVFIDKKTKSRSRKAYRHWTELANEIGDYS